MDKYTFDNERWIKDCKSAMEKHGYSLRQLEGKIGTSYSSLHRILNKKKEAKIGEFIRLSAILELEAIIYFDVDEVQLKMF